MFYILLYGKKFPVSLNIKYSSYQKAYRQSRYVARDLNYACYSSIHKLANSFDFNSNVDFAIEIVCTAFPRPFGVGRPPIPTLDLR